MGKILNRGNIETERTLALQDDLGAQMWQARDDNLIEVYRVCDQPELFNTWFYCFAGGSPQPLTQEKPDESTMVEQVGNNEGIGKRVGVDPRIALLMKLQGHLGKAPPKRTVIECSWRPATQFGSKFLKIWVNRNFTGKGTGLEFEGGGGVIIQIGTPLAAVEAEQGDVDASYRII